MSCSETCTTTKETTAKQKCHNGSSYVIVLVLYILLAIIIGSCLFS